MSTPHSELPPLSESQREIMEIIWDLGEASARDVREVLLRSRDVARNTVRTLLERMEEKGWLVHREQARTYLYSAVLPREATVGQRVIEVIDNVCGGSPETLMTALLDYRGLTPAELKRIRRMLDGAKRTSKQSQKRGNQS
ncbi:MAG: BlaI/MecI/CopY family transcriptional regulator [Pirellulaceae bacterium]|nr:BlaI/MecI/CopY family transcriptional regulator [Pirellulaceae bacterium]